MSFLINESENEKRIFCLVKKDTLLQQFKNKFLNLYIVRICSDIRLNGAIRTFIYL